MRGLTLTVRQVLGSNQYEFDATTAAGIREVYVLGVWPVVVAAMRAYVEGLQ